LSGDSNLCKSDRNIFELSTVALEKAGQPADTCRENSGWRWILAMAEGRMTRVRRNRRAESTPAAFERAAVAVAAALAAFSLLFAAGCAVDEGLKLTPALVLARSVEELLSLKSYRYSGTTSLDIAGRPELDNKAASNGGGALDGHMVVDSPGGSYETYTRDGVRYTRVEGSDWYRVEGDPGMVSANARRVIARFADLVDNCALESQTAHDYTISFSMGEKYRLGASAIVGPEQGTCSLPPPAWTSTRTLTARPT